MKNKILILMGFMMFVSVIGYSTYSKGAPQRDYGASREVISVAGDENHPPYEYMDRIGNYKGFNVDIINALSIELGMDIEFIPMNWREALRALENKEVDVIQGMSSTEERKEKYLFTIPTVTNSQSIFVLKDTSIVFGLEDLSGMKVAFQAGDLNEEILADIPDITLLPKKDQNEAMDSLINGEADAYVGNRLTGLFYLQKSKNSSTVKIVGEQMATSEYGPATYRGNEELVHLFNKGIEAIKSNGTYDKIYEKWFGKDIGNGRILNAYLKETILSVFTLSIIFLLFILWNKNLKKEVLKRTMDLENINQELLLEKEKVHNLAYYDGITKLPNRVYLLKILGECIDSANDQKNRFGILNLDLDRFKHINDTLGHHMGDEILKLVGERIGRILKPNNFFARFGGDEFIILVKHIQEDKELIDLANQIIKEMDQPFMLNSHRLFLTTSIGISIYPEGGETLNDLMKNSDIAMYAAKGKGGNQYYIYDKSLSEKQMEALILINQLRNAVDHDELTLFYQPIMNTSTGNIVGVEALLRWYQPGHGMIGPNTFIPLAEETDLIISIGKWVFRNVCAQIKDWIHRGYDVKRVYINVSAKQFQEKGFLESILQALKEAELPPKYIGIEITETVIIQDIDHTIELIKKLKDIGISISIDDFGTGYSNFNYLKEMGVDEIKIDRSFIAETTKNSKKRAITKTIILLAHQLDIAVTAEGVETKEQLEFLRESSCSKIQGFYYSRPVPPEEFEKFLNHHIR
ncbi:EAL domain-containing protein [Alkaliphilus oremlandii]|nr:EAL domain-containing protein [Alkaliphilus oremlandii]